MIPPRFRVGGTADDRRHRPQDRRRPPRLPRPEDRRRRLPGVEHVAYEAIRAYLPERLEADPPAVVLEHYPPLGGRRRRTPGRGDVDRVTFATWRPMIDWLGGVQRVRFGEPSWCRVDAEELARLIGEGASLDD
jgi:hypothetical protein